MKLFFNKGLLLFLILIFLFSAVSANTLNAEYKIEVGGIDIGKLSWIIKTDSDSYEIRLNLKDKGFLSGLYSFSGEYYSRGLLLDNSFVPNFYSQKWKTKRKEKNVKIFFSFGKIDKLVLNPEEKESARVSFVGKSGFKDPLASFVDILKGHSESKTVDGRRFYTMAAKVKSQTNSMIYKEIHIENYINIWADHKRNDINKIDFEKNLNNKNNFLPEKIKIKYKGLSFNLIKN